MGLTDLDEAGPRPYVRLAARLRRSILDGEVAPGQRGPVDCRAQPGIRARTPDVRQGHAVA
jgi:hypothetical protein